MRGYVSAFEKAKSYVNSYGKGLNNNAKVLRQVFAKNVVGTRTTIGVEIWDEVQFIKLVKPTGKTLISKRGTQGILLEEVNYEEVIPVGITENLINTCLVVKWVDKLGQIITIPVDARRVILTSKNSASTTLLLSSKKKKMLDSLKKIGLIYITQEC